MSTRTLVVAMTVLIGSSAGVLAQTCADQHAACLKRGHSESECRKSTNRCLASGRWIGPAGNEFPITKKK